MTYKKKFTRVNAAGTMSPLGGGNLTGSWNSNAGQNNTPTGGWNNNDFGYKNYRSRLPEVYTGHPPYRDWETDR